MKNERVEAAVAAMYRCAAIPELAECVRTVMDHVLKAVAERLRRALESSSDPLHESRIAGEMQLVSRLSLQLVKDLTDSLELRSLPEGTMDSLAESIVSGVFSDAAGADDFTLNVDMACAAAGAWLLNRSIPTGMGLATERSRI